MEKKNFTKIPNKILAEMARSLAFCEKTRVFCAILRKTAGWNKKADWIALSQFEDLTGMAKPNVCRTLRKLLDEKIIIKVDNKYRINDITARWKALSKRTPFIKTDKVDYQNGQSGLSKSTPTKETLTKNKYIQKKKGKGQNNFDPPPLIEIQEIFKDRMLLSDFEIFWELYPRKENKSKAMHEFWKIPKELLPKILTAIEDHSESKNWTKDEGRFIPHAVNWLRDYRWEDDPEEF